MSEEKNKDQEKEIDDKKNGDNLEEKVLRLETELKDANDKYLRALAEQQNLVKRQATEKEEFVKYANQEIISEFLMVYDHLRMSVGFLPEAEKQNAWVKGVEMTIKQFKDLLSVNGVEEVKTVGEKFDPNTMEAIEGAGEKVAKEIMAGYKLNGKVIRAARVSLDNKL